jgi:hypothetical protein
MTTKITAVISNFNLHPITLADYFESYVLYDQSTDESIQAKVIQSHPDVTITQNSGHSISHYLKFIIENYNNLPDEIIFLKSNVVPRHIDKFTFESLIKIPGLLPIYNDSQFVDKPGIAHYLYPGLLLEKNNSWYCSSKSESYFHSYNQFYAFLFGDSQRSEWTLFAPGANYRVPSSKILKYPIFFWELINYLVTYRFFPQEAYIVERMLFTIFLSGCELDSKHISIEQMVNDLPVISYLESKSISKRFMSAIKNVLARADSKHDPRD